MTFIFAPLDLIEDFLHAGWVVAKVNAPMHHHEYSFLCQWLCGCNPAIPRRAE